MGKMYTLKPDESINDHMKESIVMLNAMADSIGVGYYHNTTTLKKITPDSARFVIEHVRDTIQMLDELCDELEDDKDEIRREYEEKVIQFFNRFMSSDLSDEYDFRMKEAVRNIHEIENHYLKEIQELTKELEEERERSNQLEEKNRKVKTQFELAKKFLHQRRAEISRLKEELRQSKIVKDAQTRVIDEKEKQISNLHHEIWELQEQVEYWEDFAKTYADHDGHKTNNPANFCGNCKYFKIHPNDVGMCENIYGRYSKTVDPDDASCQAFESNNPTVVIDKPEFPCCEHCSHEDCDDCNLCPF